MMQHNNTAVVVVVVAGGNRVAVVVVAVVVLLLVLVLLSVTADGGVLGTVASVGGLRSRAYGEPRHFLRALTCPPRFLPRQYC